MSVEPWYKLDNAAKIYPASVTEDSTQVFRVACILKNTIDPIKLEKALNKSIKRYPAIAIRMKKGIFWYYFEKNNNPAVLHKEGPPCAMVDTKKNNDYLFKVSYYNKRISLECMHSLTDGTGALEFLKTIVYEYFQELGYKLDSHKNVKIAKEIANKYETEDSFSKYYKKEVAATPKEELAQQIEGTLSESSLAVYNCILSVKELKEKIKRYNCTITEYIASLYIYSIYQENLLYGIYNNPVRLSIPVNLRKIFLSKTMRNFSSYVNVSIYIKENLTLEEIIDEVRKQLRKGVEKKELYSRINYNVKMEKGLFLRLVPLFIKNIIMKIAKDKSGSKVMTSSFSNTGIVRLPECMSDYVDRFEFVLGSDANNKINCSACSFNDKMVIGFSSSIIEHHIIHYFFKALNEEVDIMVYSNQGEKYD